MAEKKWRGKPISEYTKYVKRKREPVEDWKFHPFFGFMILNPKKYGKKWSEWRINNILNKKGGYEALKRTKQLPKDKMYAKRQYS